jgi:hypothetical protein
MYFDMTPESRNSPLPDNGSLTHVSVTASNIIIAKQRVGKHVPAATNSPKIIHCWTMVLTETVKHRKIE